MVYSGLGDRNVLPSATDIHHSPPTYRPTQQHSNKTGQDVSYDRCLEVCLESSTRKTHHHGFRLAATGRSAAELKESIKDALEEGVFKPVTQVGFACMHASGSAATVFVCFICPCLFFLLTGRTPIYT